MISIIVGTRPEIIKMAPVIRACEKQRVGYQIIHTGQHYSYELDRIFFRDLELPEANYNLDVGSGTHGEQTGKILIAIEKILMAEKPKVVLVEGDTNSTLAAALAATKLHIEVGHIEAGLRSYFRGMPEEINRILTDHISDYLFAPTENARKILLGEGISKEKIFVAGNTIVDSVYQNLDIAKKKIGKDIFEKLDIKKGEYFLVTAHRAENVDSKKRLVGIVKALNLISKKFNLPLIYPIHPRTMKNLKKFDLLNSINKQIKLIEPIGFLEFLQLEANAKLVLTDSGGVQEETCILRIPCVTLRDNTERPETIEVGSNILAGCDPEKILKSVDLMIDKKRDWKNPFGDGKAGERIIKIVEP